MARGGGELVFSHVAHVEATWRLRLGLSEDGWVGGAFGVGPSPPCGMPRAPAAGVFGRFEMEPE